MDTNIQALAKLEQSFLAALCDIADGVEHLHPVARETIELVAGMRELRRAYEAEEGPKDAPENPYRDMYRAAIDSAVEQFNNSDSVDPIALAMARTLQGATVNSCRPLLVAVREGAALTIGERDHARIRAAVGAREGQPTVHAAETLRKAVEDALVACDDVDSSYSIAAGLREALKQ